MKVTRLSDDYLNEMNRLFKNKYIISDVTYSNQYLNMELINDEKSNILLI